MSSPWTVFVVQHSHIDLGFTDRQEVITDFHRQFMDQALTLALSDANAARPAESRFKFTCEGFWAVEQFLAVCGPEKQARLVQALRSGTLELTAFYLHLTELLDLGHLQDTLKPAREFADAHQVPLQMAMACDINGLSWGMADALAESGIRCLSTNINEHHGGCPNGGPLNAFHWEGPHGGRVLVWNGLPYHKANLLGLIGGVCPVGNAGVPGITHSAADAEEVEVTDIRHAERLLPPVLAGLEAEGYPYRFLPLMGSGLYTDNSPPSDTCCRLIEDWNARHGAQVRIQTATLAEFFAHLEKNRGDLPVFRGDWPDWWSDGVASAPVDTLLFRNAQRVKRLAERLDPAGRVMTPERSGRISRALCLYAEHTFGYSDTSSPKLLSQQVFRRKSRLAVDADMEASAALDAVLRLRGESPFTAERRQTYTVINANAEETSALAALPVSSWERLPEPYTVIDAAGKTYPHQAVPDSRGWRIFVPLALAPGEEKALRIVSAANDFPAPAAGGNTYENAFVRVRWSDALGIYSFADRETGLELLDPASRRALGAPVYQVFPGGSRWAAAGFNRQPRHIPAGVKHEGVCQSCRATAHGPVFTSVTADYEVAGTSGYQVEVRFAHALRQSEVTVRVSKTSETDPEGLYAAFPFTVPEGVWHLDKPGGLVRPGIDQIPGTCCDYYLVQDGAAYAGPKMGLVWTTLDAPLVHVGDLRLWQYGTAIAPEGAVYSWLTNNKWDCNFPRDCGGNFEFRYVLEAGPHLASPAAAAARLRTHAGLLTVVRTG